MLGTTTFRLCPIGKTILAILVVAVILVIYMYYKELGDIDASLYGMWRSDPDFNDKAGLDSMYMFISPPGNDAGNSIGPFSTQINMYILIKAGGATTFNSTVRATIRRTSARIGALHTYIITFPKKMADLPSPLGAEFNPVASMLTLHGRSPGAKSGETTVFGRLFKQPEASFFCTSAAASGDLKKGKNAQKEAAAQDDSEGDKEAAEEAQPAENAPETGEA